MAETLTKAKLAELLHNRVGVTKRKPERWWTKSSD